MVPGERWRRLGIAGATVLAVILLGTLLRLPPPGGDRLRVATAGEPIASPVNLDAAVLRRVDPVTLAGQHTPVPMPSPQAWTVASAEGRLVAVSGFASFTVYDAATLEVQAVLEDGLPGRVTVPPRFTPEGDALVGHLSQVVIYRPLDPGLPTVTMPLPVVAWEVVPLGAGRAAVFGVGEVAQVLVVDLLAGAILAEIPLPDVRAERSPGNGLATEPGLGWDVNRQRLYVAQAGGVTVVDLSAGAVLSARSATGPVVEGTVERAAVSPDGSHLYATGTRPAGAGETTLGLEVVTTSDLETVTTFGLPVGSVEVSPDGRWLALGGGASGVFVVAAGEHDVRVTLGDPDSRPLGFDATSRMLYIGGRRLLALDLHAERVVGTRQLDDGTRFLPAASLLVEPG